MNPILNDGLVQKYFGCGHPVQFNALACDCNAVTALRVLDAMTATIRPGEKCLSLYASDHATLETFGDGTLFPLHPYFLRLPDSHQEPDYEKELEKRRSNVFVASTVKFVDEIIDLARKAERQKMEREARR